MPSFLSDDEFERFKASGDASAVAEKADSYIRDLYANLETVKAEADAASITAEQTCSLLEHKYLSLSSEFSALETRYSELDSNLLQRVSELAQVQSNKHQLHLKFIEKDGEIERLSIEVKELQNSKRQVVELVGVRDEEISEKKATIKSYHDKITSLTERSSQREAKLSELEAELMRCKANCDKLSREKELIEKHNTWLNEELTAKVDSLLEQRRKCADMEADYSMKLADMEKQYNECSSSLSRHKEMVRELESKVENLHRELCSARDDASASEQQYAAEISTVSKLADLYKESSEEWSKKAGELEGVIKALETHLSQVESDYKDKLEKETAARKEVEKVSAELKEKLEKCEAELESSRRENELDNLPLSSFTTERLTYPSNTNDFTGDNLAIVPHVPAGVSGTALAASLLREGWSLAKMYTKYQEAADALRHEQLGRKQTQAILERVLLEIEEKASVILDERAEHDRMAEAYAVMNQKLQQSLSEQSNLDKVIRELKAEVKKHEREYKYAQKEIRDLQTQVTILLKECRDVQLRCGLDSHEYLNDDIACPLSDIDDESGTQKVISEHLLSIKDIKGLVEQNAKLRSLVRSLSDDIENKEMQLKEQYEEELQKHKEEAASKVAAVLERAEEQRQMIDSLHSSVAMYRRLYEEEYRLRSSSQPVSIEPPPSDGRKDFMLLLEGSQEATKKVQEQASERLRCLEDELANRKAEIITLRSERDKFALGENFAQEKLERFMKEFDNQRQEMNGVLSRNVEFSQLIVDYQKKLREAAESVNTAEELSRKLNMELSVLKHEKELLLNSEKRAQDEVQDLSKRVYRLQATLDTIQSTEQAHEEARVEERRKQEEYIKKIEREWAEAKKELQEEKIKVQTLSLDHDHTIKDGRRQIENLGKELAAALQAVTAAEARAAVAEARCADLERNLKSSEYKVAEQDGGLKPSSSAATESLGDVGFREEIERLKAEVQASKDHMLQYKSIAEVNDAALKQMEGAHDNFRIETEQMKKTLEAEIQSLRDRVHELENESSLKSEEVASVAAQKDEALASAFAEINCLKEETLNKVSQLEALEVHVTGLKNDLEREHQRALAAQANYERQVMLQSETIQELTKTSQALASLQEEASELRKTVAAYKSENDELKSKWDLEKSEMEKSRSEVAKKYDELNDQNKVLHCQLEAMHMKLAGKDAGGVTSAGVGADSLSDDGLHSVVSYLRRSKEIAETEISLLKQEKMRLQSQLERALKAAEAAEASRSAERSSSRNLMFSEDEFKALKLQVSEMNLLRESNMQLREENRYNFEECQKLREVAQNTKAEADNIQNLLREKELEAEALKKDNELQKKEKELLESRISDMLEKSKSFDLEDYNRLRSEVEQLQASLREKDAMIEETRKLVSQKEEIITKLEQDLSRIKLDLTEKENRLSLAEANLKLDADHKKKAFLPYKRRIDMLLREKEALSKEKEALSKEKETLSKEKEALSREKESLLTEREALLKERELWAKEKEMLNKEKDEASKEKQAISKQLEDLRQEKKSTGDTPADPAAREKDARIQILENTVGRLREDTKKEKGRRMNYEKVITTKAGIVKQEKEKFENEWGKHQEALKKISDELEKLKNAKDSLPEGTSVVQLLSGTTLDDMASAYVLAVENFEREANSVLNDIRNQAVVSNSSATDPVPSVAGSSQAVPAEGSSTISSMVSATCPPTKVTEEREKRVMKTMVETRKTGRKLVRPRLLKSEDAQRDVEMSELDGKNVGKPSLVAQPSVSLSSEPLVRKRPASPSPSELEEQSSLPGDSSSDLPAPALKKSKGLEPVQEDVQATSAALDNVEVVPTVEELLDAAAFLPQDSIEEASDFGKDDFEQFQGLGKEPGESNHTDEEKLADAQNDCEIVDEEHAEKPSEADLMLDDSSNLQADQDFNQQMADVADREEGEMLPEGSDLDGGDDTATVEIQDASEVQPDHLTAASIPSPAPNDDDPVAAVNAEVNETNSPEISNANDQTEEGELAEDVADDSNKSTEGNDQIAGDAELTSEPSLCVAEGNPSSVESSISREDSPNVMASQEATQPSHMRASSTTIMISERAKERAAARLGRSPAPDSTPPAARRGRVPTTRSRGARGSRGGGRRPSSGDQS
ncbi:nuclear-pore anchor-like [Chenopodium quinoa]|uniref:Nucleoprotein TPR/MLP1 domain-containing protein n=1 Tax=Chenopodium quinoa TaxID=63459 RepID=A0A803LL08_CHEQI|nr:nuclear-pore anchor-like [Chenopodium quinoa]